MKFPEQQFTFKFSSVERDVSLTLHDVHFLPEVLEVVQSFLQAVGYVFDIHDRLEVVSYRDEEECCMEEEEEEDEWLQDICGNQSGYGPQVRQ